LVKLFRYAKVKLLSADTNYFKLLMWTSYELPRTYTGLQPIRVISTRCYKLKIKVESFEVYN